jgi:hypothetical protein
MSFLSILDSLFGVPAKKPVSTHRLQLHDEGYITQLLADPKPTKCPHCGEQQPPAQLKTRKRRITVLRNSAGAVLHYEIEP